MATILDQIMDDIKVAMKAHDSIATTALRGLHSAIKDATVNAGKEVTDEIIVSCVNKAIKQREDSIAQFEKGGRADLAEKETRELELIKKYQPKQMTEEEIEVVVREVIAATGVTSLKEKGKLMGALMPRVKGKADGKLVNAIVGKILS